MKQLLLFFLSCVLLSSGCKKQKPVNPIDQLPAATQEGKNTFGCLVNGKVFLPKGSSLGPILSSYYQYIYSPSPQGYVFQVAARDNSHEDDRFSVVLLVDSIKLVSPTIIPLKKSIKGNGGGAYYSSIFNGTAFLTKDFFTTNQTNGELTITKFDTNTQIVSGTFWFDAVNSNGDTIKVTEGRFDMKYTR
jgi:hypothetical protein